MAIDWSGSDDLFDEPRRKRMKAQMDLKQRIAELEDEWRELCSKQRFDDAQQIAQRLQELRCHLNNTYSFDMKGDGDESIR